MRPVQCNIEHPWPKLLAAKQEIATLIKSAHINIETLSNLLNNEYIAPDHLLPNTDIAETWGKPYQRSSSKHQNGTTLNHGIRYDTSGATGEPGFTLTSTVIGSSIAID